MVRHFFVFLLLIPFAVFGNPGQKFHAGIQFRKSENESKIILPFHLKPDSLSTFFYSIGTEWMNFYCFGQTQDGFWNYSCAFLPSSLNMEFRQNVLELDNEHSYSVGFDPMLGFAILGTYDNMGVDITVPAFIQYNIGLGATHRSKREVGHSFGAGPSINFFNKRFDEFKPDNMISIDVQYSTRTILENGKIKYNYIRAGIDPSEQSFPQRGFHFDFGVGREFGK